MANELKPCPFCGNEPSLNHMGSGCFMVSCSNGHHINTEASKEKAIKAWNTRPTAPVEGLEVVSYEVFYAPTREWTKTTIPNYYRENDNLVRELVTRSQAEAIIAAKDAEIADLKAVIVVKDHGLKLLEADNAALTARVKELETERDEALDDAKFAERIATKREIDANASVEALETQLAAARKALERADEALQLGATEPGHTYVKIALGEVQS